MSPQLHSISIRDFRSVRGLITIPLEAPIVLIHGPNGIGKTSVLSAIELGLTGSIPSMDRVDPDYVNHLPHMDAESASISLNVDGLDSSRKAAELLITRDTIQNTKLLNHDLSRFFSERCYLSQSTLGRLLEIYQHKDSRESDTPLTQFVKDLLGLDHLDALIDGLHAAGDVRRLRRAIPDYRDVEESKEHEVNRLTKAQAEIKKFETEIKYFKNLISEAIKLIEPTITEIKLSPANIGPLLETDTEEQRLIELAALRRDLTALQTQWSSLSGASDASAAEREESEVASALTKWREGEGAVLETLITDLGRIFPNLPSSSRTDPELAQNSAASVVSAELNRCTELINRQDTNTSQLEEIDQLIGRRKARLARLDEKIGDIAGNADSLAQTLAQLIPHVNSDDCPVCGRDYSEVSSEPLASRLSEQVTTLRNAAGRLQELSREKSQVTNSLSSEQRQRELLVSQKIDPDSLNHLKTRQALMAESSTKLESLRDAAANGATLLSLATKTNQALTKIRSLDQTLNSLRLELARIKSVLQLPDLKLPESTDEALNLIELALEQQYSAIEKTQGLRRNALKYWNRLQEIEGNLLRHRQEADVTIEIVKSLDRKLARANTLRSKARSLSQAARETRTDIVRKVFNDTLNNVWRDLFLRLAPEEPFVPAFALPNNISGPVEALLETQYRSGGRGGNPRAILSAGNLNTAALTLFFALHLSVYPKLPWLILDDPVQSMDDVHVAQFAALLRTLSKQHSRQLVIAVHEQPLFEYLALELSPAFDGDRLITIELGRSSDGMTTVNYNQHVWKPDAIVAV